MRTRRALGRNPAIIVGYVCRGPVTDAIGDKVWFGAWRSQLQGATIRND